LTKPASKQINVSCPERMTPCVASRIQPGSDLLATFRGGLLSFGGDSMHRYRYVCKVIALLEESPSEASCRRYYFFAVSIVSTAETKNGWSLRGAAEPRDRYTPSPLLLVFPSREAPSKALIVVLGKGKTAKQTLCLERLFATGVASHFHWCFERQPSGIA
jgi:hypothetical protein